VAKKCVYLCVFRITRANPAVHVEPPHGKGRHLVQRAKKVVRREHLRV
jgi:hypothetical protein